MSKEHSLRTDSDTLGRILDVVVENGDPDGLNWAARKICQKLLRDNVDLFKPKEGR